MMTMVMEWSPPTGPAALASCSTGIKKTATQSSTDSAGCLLAWCVQVLYCVVHVHHSVGIKSYLTSSSPCMCSWFQWCGFWVSHVALCQTSSQLMTQTTASLLMSITTTTDCEPRRAQTVSGKTSIQADLLLCFVPQSNSTNMITFDISLCESPLAELSFVWNWKHCQLSPNHPPKFIFEWTWGEEETQKQKQTNKNQIEQMM